MDSWEKMYSVKEVSAITGWSSDTIRRLVYRGDLKAATLPRQSNRRRRIYRSVRIAESVLRIFLKANQNG
ncbi:MAG: helix-turn-helix domain-containing protein [Terriglobales bacterium]